MRLLHGIPSIESPLFDAEFADAELTAVEREIAMALNHDGYAVIDFPDPEIDARVERIKARLTKSLADAGVDGDGVGPGVDRIQDAWTSDPDVRAIAANRHVLDLLEKLYGRAAFPFQTLNFRVGTQQALHTDAVHFSSIPPRFMCGVWLAMEDVPAEAGPLNYVPGSHKWPMIDNALVGRLGYGQPLGSAQTPYHEVWGAMIAATGGQIETFLPRKGQALIWCANLLHGGSPRADPSLSRWSQVTHYYFDDCVYYTPAFSDEYLGRLQLREPVSVIDGLPRRNLYLGEEIVSQQPPAKPGQRGAWRKLRRFLRNTGKASKT